MNFLPDRYGVGQEDVLGAAFTRFPHGLLVVSSPDSTDDHASWDASVEAIHAAKDSLYVSTQQAASGLVAVVCVSRDVNPGHLSQVFRGELELPRKSLAIYDPGGTMNVVMPVSGSRNLVTIYSDDPDEPSELLVSVIEL